MSELISGIVKCWNGYGMSYLIGARNTLIVSFIGTVVGCIIGFGVGIVQTIPKSKSDPLWKRALLFLVNLILKVYVEVFRGTR